MVRELVHDPILLARKSLPATEADLPIARDLLDTLLFHREGCVGMAANMIGQFVNIIAFDCEGSYMVMFNPEILRRDKEYETQEGSFPCWAAPGLPAGGRASRFAIRMRKCRLASRPSPAGRLRSSSMRSTIAMGC